MGGGLDILQIYGGGEGGLARNTGGWYPNVHYDPEAATEIVL